MKLRPTLLLAAACLAAAGPAHALYKVVAPDGSVTYTDRAPGGDAGRVANVRRDGQVNEPAAPNLPLELRQATQRFPVTLYSGADCAPCDEGRKLLQERGVPYSEKRVASEDDLEALVRATGIRAVPVLSVGSQALRGYSDAEWHLYLDTAGYPRESKLPRGWQAAPATTVATRKPPPPKPTPEPPPAETAQPDPLPAQPAGLRF